MDVTQRWVQTALETMRLGVAVSAPDGRMLYANRAEAAMHGYELDEYMRLDPRELSPPGDRKARDAAALDGFRRWERERLRVRRDGTTFLVRLVSDVARDADGRPSAIVTTCEDLSERTEQERAARAVEERYQRFFREDLAGALITDLAGRVLDCNPAFLALVGASSREEIAARSVESFLAEPADWVGLEGRLRTERRVRSELNLVRMDGSRAVVLANVAAGEADGDVAWHVVDLTEQKALEAQLRQAMKMDAVGKLAGGVAHDFNNFLVVIGGYAEQLFLNLPEGDTRREMAQSIMLSAEKAARLTQQLLAFSRREVVRPRVVDVGAAVAEMEKIFRRVVGEDVELDIEAPTEGVFTEIDPGQLEQVLLNLVVNARDAMAGTGGRLRVSTTEVTVDAAEARRRAGLQAGRYALLTVTDTGLGMTPDTQAHLFEPFFTTKPKGLGTGLGLATVYGIVKRAEGYVAVESEPGHGATFFVYLPWRDGAASVDQPEATTTPARAEGHTILLVEDEANVRALVRTSLERLGYRVLEAPGGAEALELAAIADDIDLLLSDVLMPRMSGPELATQLVARLPGLRVLFMSGHADEALGAAGVLEPGVTLLQKPFRSDTLARAVRDVLLGAPRVRGGAALRPSAAPPPNAP